MYNPDSYPQTSGIPTSMLKGGSVEKSADPSKPGKFTPGQLAQKVSSYSKTEDGFESAANLARYNDLEPAVVKMRGGYENLKNKALRRLPDVLANTLDAAQSLGFDIDIVKDVQGIPGMNLKTPENRKVFSLEKHYNNELNNKLLFHIRYDPDHPDKAGPKGKGSMYTPQQSLIYCHTNFEISDVPNPTPGYYYDDADQLINVITAYDAVFKQGDAVDPMGVYSNFEDQLILEAIDYVNLNIDEIRTKRKTPEDIARLILEDYNFIYDTLYAAKVLETELPKHVLQHLSGFVEDLPASLDYTIKRFAERVEAIFNNKGLGEL